jgi:hypothetical protein
LGLSDRPHEELGICDGHTWRGDKIIINTTLLKESSRDFGVRYSSVGFTVGLFERIIKRGGGGEYMYRELVKILKLFL